jgi:hypothetical protein
MVPHIFEGLDALPLLPNGKVNRKGLKPPDLTGASTETVIELDSLGQMRKFSRNSAAEDRVLDNVRAILIAVVILSHVTPLQEGCRMFHDHPARPLMQEWSSTTCYILSRSRAGGWSSLAFLSGFDDTRSQDPYGLTYREPLFLLLWALTFFDQFSWYLPAFAYMRVAFCLAKRAGFERVHLMLASQLWLLLPAAVDLYAGFVPWHERHSTKLSSPKQCTDHCFCPFETVPWAQELAYMAVGWWDTDVSSSFLGRGLIFIPCYWLGFYVGPRAFRWLIGLLEEQKPACCLLAAAAVLATYLASYDFGLSVQALYDDRCSSFWSGEGILAWHQILWNLGNYSLNLAQSMLIVVFLALAVPFHLKTMAKVCFAALLASPHTPCLLDLPVMVIELRKLFGQSSIFWLVEVLWVLSVPVLYTLLAGSAVAWLAGAAARGCLRVWKLRGGHIMLSVSLLAYLCARWFMMEDNGYSALKLFQR